MIAIFKNKSITTSMKIHLTKEEIVEMFGNKEIELLDEQGNTIDTVYLHKIENNNYQSTTN